MIEQELYPIDAPEVEQNGPSPTDQAAFRELPGEQIQYMSVLMAAGHFLPMVPLLPSLRNSLDNGGNSIWHHLCYCNSEFARLLLKNGVLLHELNQVNISGLRPIEVAAMHCEEDLLRALWQAGARGKVLYWAARGNNSLSLSIGDFTDHKGNSAVHYAAQNGTIDVFDQLVKRFGPGSLVKRNGAGLLPLSIAFDWMAYGAVSYLLMYTKYE